jgi:hypothetical protein
MVKPTLKPLPYDGTDVPVDRSKKQIWDMLVKTGADGVSWTEVFRPIKKAMLQFVKDGVKYHLEVPIYTEDLERNKDLIAPYRLRNYMERREKAMYRALFFYVQALVKAQEHGLLRFEEAFASHIQIQLPSGEVSSIGQAVADHKVDLSKALPAGEPSKDGEIVDADWRRT